jgi:hypothetical protein
LSLERDLAVLAEAVEWPETPDLAGRLRLEPRRRSHRRRILAVVLVLLAGAAAVPEVRAAVGRVLGFAGGERVERTTEPPRPGPRLDLGAAVTLEQAQRRAGFHVGVPHAQAVLGARLGGALGDRTVSLLLPSGAVLSQRPGRAAIFAAKQVGPGVEVSWVDVNGRQAVWIGSGPRSLVVMRKDGTEQQWSAAVPGAGVLLWDHAGVALRLETRASRAEALAIAESVR